MKKNILIVLFIYFVITFSYSQTITFNKTYNPYAYQEADNIVVYKDGYLMLGGGIDATESGQKVKIIAYYLDEYGTVNWMKTYGDTVYNYYFGDRNSIIENVDGGFSLTGARTGQGNITGMLTKFDQNFDTLWTRLYFDNPAFTAFYNHVQTPDGGYALVGCIADTDPDGDVLLVKTDSEGNMEWYKKYGTSEYDLGLCLVITPDNGFLIGGGSYFYGNGDNYLIKTDSLGNLEWTKNYGSTCCTDGGITNIQITNDLGYVCTASHTIYEDGMNGYLKYGKASIKKIDHDFNDVWYKLYGNITYQTGFGSVVETINGDFALTLFEDYPSRSKLLFLNSEGDSLRQVGFEAEGSLSEQWLLAIKQTPDNGFIMAGVAYEPQVMWLVKTDSCGCVEEDCECGGNAVESITGVNQINVYPNPASGSTTVTTPAEDVLELYSSTGSVVLKTNVGKGETRIALTGLMPGMYLARLKNTGFAAKIIVQ